MKARTYEVTLKALPDTFCHPKDAEQVRRCTVTVRRSFFSMGRNNRRKLFVAAWRELLQMAPTFIGVKCSIGGYTATEPKEVTL